MQINTSGRQDVNIEERESDACTRDLRGRMEEQEAIFFEVNRVCTWFNKSLWDTPIYTPIPVSHGGGVDDGVAGMS